MSSEELHTKPIFQPIVVGAGRAKGYGEEAREDEVGYGGRGERERERGMGEEPGGWCQDDEGSGRIDGKQNGGQKGTEGTAESVAEEKNVNIVRAKELFRESANHE